MSGHSKWTQIKRQKGVTDIKRGQAFTKLSNTITLAVREGGGVSDPEQNFKLRLAIEKAKSINMSKDTIERAIEKGKGRGLSGEGLEEVVYEGFAPGGIAVMVEAATDKKIRTTSEIKNIFDKSGGTLGQPGSVSYQFRQMGKIVIEKGEKTLDDIFLQVAESGASDVEEEEGKVTVYTAVPLFMKVREFLQKQGFVITEMEIMRKPIAPPSEPESEEVMQKVAGFIEKLESMDDVQKVYVNLS